MYVPFPVLVCAKSSYSYTENSFPCLCPVQRSLSSAIRVLFCSLIRSLGESDLRSCLTCRPADGSAVLGCFLAALCSVLGLLSSAPRDNEPDFLLGTKFLNGIQPPHTQKHFLFVRQNCACDNMPVEIYCITAPITEKRITSVVIMLCSDRWQRCFQWAQHEIKRSNHDVVPLTLKWHCVSAVLPLKKRNYSPVFPSTAGAHGVLFQETACLHGTPLLYWLQERTLQKDPLTTSPPLSYWTRAVWKVGKIQALTVCFNKVWMFFSVDVTFSVQFLSYYILKVKCAMGICVLDMSVVLPHCLFNRLLAGSVLSLLQNSAYGGNQFPLPGHMWCIILYCLEVVDISDLSLHLRTHFFLFFLFGFFFLLRVLLT